MRTGLLVSVRDCSEALDALAAGVDLIDLKEPRRGSLGAVDAGVMREVVRQVAGRVPVSAALGELLADAAITSACLPAGIGWTKLGLAGCANHDDWPRRWSRAIRQLPAGTAAVAVAYADWRRAEAPPPETVIDFAPQAGCRAVLVDTWRKNGDALLDLWSLAECGEAVRRIQDAGLLAVLAGSLTCEMVRALVPLAPDYVAVRGAVCGASRTDRLDPARVRQLAGIVGRGELAIGDQRQAPSKLGG